VEPGHDDVPAAHWQVPLLVSLYREVHKVMPGVSSALVVRFARSAVAYIHSVLVASLDHLQEAFLLNAEPFLPTVCCRDTLEQCRAHGIDEVMRATIMDPIPINYGPWLTMSEEGLSFLQSLMLRNPAQRLSAAQALEHPWFATQFEEAGLSVSSGQQVLRSNASEAGDNISATDEKLDHRNNIVPMPQQQHQQLQSHSSLHCKPSVHSM